MKIRGWLRTAGPSTLRVIHMLSARKLSNPFTPWHTNSTSRLKQLIQRKRLRSQKRAGNRRWEGTGKRIRNDRERAVEKQYQRLKNKNKKKSEATILKTWFIPNHFFFPSELNLFPILPNPHLCSTVAHFVQPLQLSLPLHLHRLSTTHRKTLQRWNWGAFWTEVGGLK